jgi:hypothetical protein
MPWKIAINRAARGVIAEWDAFGFVIAEWDATRCELPSTTPPDNS